MRPRRRWKSASSRPWPTTPSACTLATTRPRSSCRYARTNTQTHTNSYTDTHTYTRPRRPHTHVCCTFRMGSRSPSRARTGGSAPQQGCCPRVRPRVAGAGEGGPCLDGRLVGLQRGDRRGVSGRHLIFANGKLAHFGCQLLLLRTAGAGYPQDPYCKTCW